MRYRLSDFADIERAKKNKDYEQGAILCQVSAAGGGTLETVKRHSGGKVESKYMTIEVKEESPLTPGFLYFYLKSTMPHYKKFILTGLNIQASEVENYPIQFPIRQDMRAKI